MSCHSACLSLLRRSHSARCHFMDHAWGVKRVAPRTVGRESRYTDQRKSTQPKTAHGTMSTQNTKYSASIMTRPPLEPVEFNKDTIALASELNLVSVVRAHKDELLLLH